MDHIIQKHRKKKQSKNYFTQETEDAIVLYNNTSDFDLKSKIYERSIHHAFFKLTQNIIHTFKFYNTDVEDLEHLQQEIIIFLLSKIHLFSHANNIQDRIKKIITKEFKLKYNKNFVDFVKDPNKVTQLEIDAFISKLKVSKECMDKLKKLTPPKAYSYFGTIVKRWLIVYNKKNYGTLVNNVSIDMLNEQSNKDSYNNISILHGNIDKITEEYSDFEIENMTEKDVDDPLSYFMDDYVSHCLRNIDTLFPKKDEAQIADAIISLFKQRSRIPIFNKKALYIHIREKVNSKTPKITKISNKLYYIFKERYLFFMDEGQLPY